MTSKFSTLGSTRLAARSTGLLALLCLIAASAHADNKGLHVPDDGSFEERFAKPHAVRNVQPIPGDEISILRTFKIKKGTFEEFYRQSEEGIWPFFEKTGGRIIGMWQVDSAAIDPEETRDYDEAILLTRYASLDHWRASRSPMDLGGNGPDAEATARAHQYRQSVTIETSFKVLRGTPARNGPYFMPAVEEKSD